MAKGSISAIFPYIANSYNPPAPALEVALSLPISSGSMIKIQALLDTGADITVIPQNIAQQLQLKYVDEVLAAGYGGIPQKKFVYSARITVDRLGDFILKVLTSEDDYVLIGRDLLNKWSVLLKGREKVFEIS